MSLTKLGTLDYEETPIKVSKRKLVKSVEETSTGVVLWTLVKRHKLFLMGIGDIVLVLNFVFPEWPQLVKSLLQ